MLTRDAPATGVPLLWCFCAPCLWMTVNRFPFVLLSLAAPPNAVVDSSSSSVGCTGWAASTQFGRFLRFRVATVPVNNVPQCHKAMRGDRIDPVDWFNPRLEWCTSAGDKTSFCAGDTGAGLYTVAKVKGVLTPIVHGIFSVRLDRSLSVLSGSLLRPWSIDEARARGHGGLERDGLWRARVMMGSL